LNSRPLHAESDGEAASGEWTGPAGWQLAAVNMEAQT
jgi:hypothetical protein